jgi:hypothetical protein
MNFENEALKRTAKAAVEYLESREGFDRLRKNFNQYCKFLYADVFNPDELSLEIDDITIYIDKEPWIKDIAAIPSFERNTQMIERVVEEFIHKYWLMEKEEITTKNVADVLLVADPLSRRHLLAQRVVIKSIGLLKTEDKIRLLDELRFLDKIMDELATNPNLKA